MEKNNLGNNCWVLGGSHSSVVSSAPTAAAGSNPEHTNYTFSICIIEIVMRKGWKETKKKPGLAHLQKLQSSTMAPLLPWIRTRVGNMDHLVHIKHRQILQIKIVMLYISYLHRWYLPTSVDRGQFIMVGKYMLGKLSHRYLYLSLFDRKSKGSFWLIWPVVNLINILRA